MFKWPQPEPVIYLVTLVIAIWHIQMNHADNIPNIEEVMFVVSPILIAIGGYLGVTHVRNKRKLLVFDALVILVGFLTFPIVFYIIGLAGAQIGP